MLLNATELPPHQRKKLRARFRPAAKCESCGHVDFHDDGTPWEDVALRLGSRGHVDLVLGDRLGRYVVELPYDDGTAWVVARGEVRE